MLFSKENGKYLLGVVNQSRASAVTALPWGSWRSTRKRPTERMFLIELYAVWEIVQYLTILGICRKLSKLKKTKNLSRLVLAWSYFGWYRKESCRSFRISCFYNPRSCKRFVYGMEVFHHWIIYYKGQLAVTSSFRKIFSKGTVCQNCKNKYIVL